VKLRFERFQWEGVQARPYKDRGTDFKGIVRHTLARGQDLPAAFELRYFELAPGGYSSLEKHRHAHFVIAVRGIGKALVGDGVTELEPFDALHVPPLAPHRWVNEGDEPFGFLCPVDADRDRPRPLDDAELAALRANAETAPYAF
jgi:quercetin dioxygenase-like cupin family protein